LGVLHLLPATFAEAQVGLAKVAITALDATRLKVAGCLAAVMGVSLLYFAGLIDLKSVRRFRPPFSPPLKLSARARFTGAKGELSQH